MLNLSFVQGDEIEGNREQESAFVSIIRVTSAGPQALHTHLLFCFNLKTHIL